MKDRTPWRIAAIAAGLLAAAIVSTSDTHAQGCVASRMATPPLTGADAISGEPGWSASFSWRYFESDRHFTGSHEERHRQAEGSEVINTVNQLNIGITRNFSERFSVTVDIPYFMMERSNPIRDPTAPLNEFGNAPVGARTETQSRGIGDISALARWWVRPPSTHPKFNFALGAGVKLPTGDSSVQDTRQIFVAGSSTFQLENVVRTNDQSIQLGDGGFGILLDLQGFYRFGDRVAGYVSGSYLVNPENMNGVATYRGGAGALIPGTPGSEAYMSVADQYLYRLGAMWFPTHSIGLSLGGRWEGVPVRDLVGDSDGFRRPGYSFAVEPGVQWAQGPHAVSVLIPIATHRNREKSVPDLQVPPRHGDSAFADYLVIAAYSRRF